jgi:enoyl-CoA hydratase/3-hydroxyacyl-CoA dehydrogenase
MEKEIKNIAVIGAGLMGSGIALVSLMAGFDKVILNDINIEIIEKGVKDIERVFKKIESLGKLGEGNTTGSLLNKLVKEADLKTAVENVDFVIEAVPEIMSLKQDLYKKLGEYAPEHAILASNTSTMSISEIGKYSNRPDKVIGMHFFIPLRMRLIEVIQGEKTSDDTVKNCEEVGNKLPCINGKRLVMTIERESPGFIVNRLAIAGNIYLIWLLDEADKKGITPEQLDADAGSFLPMGLYEMLDQLGLDVIYHTLKYFEEVLSPDFAPGKVLTQKINNGELGKKTGKGMYEWAEGKVIKQKGVKKAEMLDLETLMAIQLNEGCRLLEEKIVPNYKMIDIAMNTGLGTPGPFTPGRKKYQEWCKLLEDFAKESGKSYVKPCDLMKSGAFLKMRK